MSSGLKKFKKMVSDKNISEEEINCSTQIFEVFEKIEYLLDIYESYLAEGNFLTDKNQIVGSVIISSSASKCIGEAIHEACSLSKGLKKLSESNQLSFNGVREYIDNLGK